MFLCLPYLCATASVLRSASSVSEATLGQTAGGYQRRQVADKRSGNTPEHQRSAHCDRLPLPAYRGFHPWQVRHEANRLASKPV